MWYECYKSSTQEIHSGKDDKKCLWFLNCVFCFLKIHLPQSPFTCFSKFTYPEYFKRNHIYLPVPETLAPKQNIIFNWLPYNSYIHCISDGTKEQFLLSKFFHKVSLVTALGKQVSVLGKSNCLCLKYDHSRMTASAKNTFNYMNSLRKPHIEDEAVNLSYDLFGCHGPQLLKFINQDSFKLLPTSIHLHRIMTNGIFVVSWGCVSLLSLIKQLFDLQRKCRAQ